MLPKKTLTVVQFDGKNHREYEYPSSKQASEEAMDI
jgi:hypothetical protein